jgi:Domain of unknown function (DUF6259)
MNRRGFFKSGAVGALTGSRLLGGVPGDSNPSRAGNLLHNSLTEAAPASNQYTEQEQRQRLKNIALCESSIESCMRKHLVTSYLPGQCTYNLGEYPSQKPWEIGEWDARELDRLKQHGIQLIQLHEEWNDSQRLFGANKYSPLNPQGFRQFLDMAHARGMKVIVYVSSGFFEKRDPEFRPEWARDQDLVELFYHYARCSPASPSWRTYISEQFVRIMEKYGVDGVYNDLGYVPLANNPHPQTKNEVLAFPESATEDGALGDLLALLYEEIKQRDGIVKVHCGATDRPLTDLKVYDYLWVGEEVESSDALRHAVKNYSPYVVPCLDMSRAKIANENELYLQAIPYMQFPLLLAGKPFTGERALVPGIQYVPESEDFWTEHCHEIWKFYQEHPNGPYSYGWWDSVPGRPGAQETHARWLALYRPMVEPGTWAWLELAKTRLFRTELPGDVVASVFANRKTYLVLANYGQKDAIVETAHVYSDASEDGGRGATDWKLGGRTLRILRMEQQ